MPAVSPPAPVAPTLAADPTPHTWRKSIARHERASLRHSLFDLATSVVPYLALTVAMYLSLDVSVWLTLALAVPAAGFLLRTFIVFHDCAHGSFLPAKRGNLWLGRLTALLRLPPFANWRHNHAVHHGTAGDLDRRGTGDVPTLTVAEYALPPLEARLGYRLFRSPVVMFGIGPIWSLMIGPHLVAASGAPAIRRSVMLTNLVLAMVIGAAAGSSAGGLPAGRRARRDHRRLGRDLALLRPAPVRGHLLGAREDWSYDDAALRGSSYLSCRRSCSSSPATSASITSTT